ncbi:hypothetical protein C7S16_3307 [Burkholderia thailandensis]|uniref:Uncharacterized protein n=1 Tax=Burkholderia thailandensis TaxID=57975 RepID=A0AAW9D5V0_BURTH|nr:hypothetical protein [Burkholderia thailandensis]MDW9257249.1 hypothetical protein [Burkholderia thailandensis]
MYEAGIALTSGAQKHPPRGVRAGGKRKERVRKRTRRRMHADTRMHAQVCDGKRRQRGRPAPKQSGRHAPPASSQRMTPRRRPRPAKAPSRTPHRLSPGPPRR